MQTLYWIFGIILLLAYFGVRFRKTSKKLSALEEEFSNLSDEQRENRAKELEDLHTKKKARLVGMLFFLFLLFFVWFTSLGITHGIFALLPPKQGSFYENRLMDVVLAIVIAWMLLASIKTVRPVHRGIVIRADARLEEVKEGPYLRFPWIDKIREIFLGQREIEIPDPERETTGVDVYTKDNKFLIPVIVVIWRVIDIWKFIEVETGEEEEGKKIREMIADMVMSAIRLYASQFKMEQVLQQGKLIVRDLIMKGEHEYQEDGESKRIDIGEGLKTLTDRWGIEIVALRLKDLDPVQIIKDTMTEAAAEEDRKKQSITKAEGDKQAKILAAEAERYRLEEVAEGQKTADIRDAEALAEELRNEMLGLGFKEKQGGGFKEEDIKKFMNHRENMRLARAFGKDGADNKFYTGSFDKSVAETIKGLLQKAIT